MLKYIMAVLLLCLAGQADLRAGDDPPPLQTRGPLRQSRDNPRYFVDAGNRIVYLTGSHSWENFQDITQTFAYPAYLDRLASLHHNFIRLWVTELIRLEGGWLANPPANENDVEPLLYLRTGPGLALDGRPRLDLSRFNPAYFDRLRSRVIQAGQRGMYVSVMFFQGFSVVTPDAWKAHPLNGSNNVNGIDGDANGDGLGMEVHRSPGVQVSQVQEAYVKQVLETLHDLDNVLYEVVNEATPESVAWQYHLIRVIKRYERERGFMPHPVGMTFFQLGEFGGGENRFLFESEADWISPGGYTKYARHPPAADGSKVMLLDTDHIHGIGGDRDYVWESFFRGYNPIYMDPLEAVHGLTIGEPVLNEPQHERARVAMGQARRWAERLDLRRVTPQGELASTGYCLADRGREYLIYVPAGGVTAESGDGTGTRPVTINLSGASGPFTVEWMEFETGRTNQEDLLIGGGERMLTVPFPGGGLLYLRKID
ncbi:MAG: hypothetical protein GDA65_08490 [Nitrospira sp. CR1.1]|nr:hypothetical protein [Nitrospira sp. CR1.1]